MFILIWTITKNLYKILTYCVILCFESQSISHPLWLHNNTELCLHISFSNRLALLERLDSQVPCSPKLNIINVLPGDFGMDDREMMREENAFGDIIHESSAANLLLEAEPGPAHLPDKTPNLDYDDFGDNNLENSDGGILSEFELSWPLKVCMMILRY